MTHSDAKWAITYLGNACVLLEVGDALVLTDPFVTPSPGIRDVPVLRPGELPPLTAIIGSHWAQDHWDIDAFSEYGYHESTEVYVSDPSMQTVPPLSASPRSKPSHGETVAR